MRHYVFLCTGLLSFLYAYLLTVSVDIGSPVEVGRLKWFFVVSTSFNTGEADYTTQMILLGAV